MPRGKKFNAAEKHFKEKEDKYRKQIQVLYDELTTVANIVITNECTIKELQATNLKQQEDIEALIAVSVMSREEFEKMRADDEATRQSNFYRNQSLRLLTCLADNKLFTGGL